MAGALGYALFVYRRGQRKVVVTVSDFEAANARAKLMKSHFPSAKTAWYDDEKGRVIVEFEAGFSFLSRLKVFTASTKHRLKICAR